MENCIRTLRSFVAANPPDFGDGDADSVLDMLYVHYNEFNGFNNAPIKGALKFGFAEGVKVGMRLEQELA